MNKRERKLSFGIYKIQHLGGDGETQCVGFLMRSDHSYDKIRYDDFIIIFKIFDAALLTRKIIHHYEKGNL